jgi:hypothetical protein
MVWLMDSRASSSFFKDVLVALRPIFLRSPHLPRHAGLG